MVPVMSKSTPLIDPPAPPSRASQLASFGRGIVGYLRQLTRDNFQCHICFDENVPASQAVTLTKCGHQFCLHCFKGYLEAKIKEGNVFPVCFHPLQQVDEMTPKTCNLPVEATQIQSIVSAEVWEKYLVFRYNKEHEYGRQCPYCSHSQECAGGPETPACTCEQCGKPFCFLHGNAHEQSTCADYELKSAKTEALNSATIKETTKPCPGCKASVEKNGGCNHMTCVACEASFCWLCSELVESAAIASHFDTSSWSTCAGRQFEDATTGLPRPRTSCDMNALEVLYHVVFFPFALVITVLLTVLCCFQSSRTFAERVQHTEEKVATVVITVPVYALGAVVAVSAVLISGASTALYAIAAFLWCLLEPLLVCVAGVAAVVGGVVVLIAAMVWNTLAGLARMVFSCCVCPAKAPPDEKDLEAGK